MIRAAAFLLLLFLVIMTAVTLIRNPELSGADSLTGFVSDNLLIAAFEFIVLYIVKGISFVFPSAVLNVAAGAVFGFPLSFAISLCGIFVEFTVLYFIGRFLGNDVVGMLGKKYAFAKKLTALHMNNGFFMSFLIRILGLISYDVGSLYLGAIGTGYGRFIIGSMLGAALNVLIATLFGEYMFHPLSWQMWAIVLIRGMVIAIAYLGQKKLLHREQSCHQGRG